LNDIRERKRVLDARGGAEGEGGKEGGGRERKCVCIYVCVFVCLYVCVCLCLCVKGPKRWTIYIMILTQCACGCGCVRARVWLCAGICA